jgi:hypothetical protein
LKNIKKDKLKFLNDVLKNEDIDYRKDYRRLLFNRIHYGIWEGKNIMGKILTYFMICLKNNIEPKIDWDLLNSKDIFWFGNKLLLNSKKVHQNQIN